MMRRVLGVLMFAGVLATEGCATAPTAQQLASADYGPTPDNYSELIQSQFRPTLFDPYSAVYEFGKPVRTWTDRPVWVVCGTVNAKNRLGGYVGAAPFYVEIREGSIIDSRLGGAPSDAPGAQIVDAFRIVRPCRKAYSTPQTQARQLTSQPALVAPQPKKDTVLCDWGMYWNSLKGECVKIEQGVTTTMARPPAQATERVPEARPLSTPPDSENRMSAPPPIVARATPRALGTPPPPDRPITVAWLTDARWEGTYRGSQVSLWITDEGARGIVWYMVARRGSQTVMGTPGSVTVSGHDATLQGRDANGVRVTFLLTRGAEGLRGEVLVGDNPPEAVSFLKGTR
jgi:hypothetical protein